MTFTMTAGERRARIVRCLTDMAPNLYPWPGDAGRYVIETCFPDATPEEWDFAAAYVRDHPEIKEGAKLAISAVLTVYSDEASAKWTEAGKAAQAGRYDDALALLREAFLLKPAEAEFWARYAQIVEDMRAARGGV